MRQAVAFAIVRKFCRRRPFARNFRNENVFCHLVRRTSRQFSQDVRPSGWFFPGFRGTHRTFHLPPHSHGRNPPHWKISGPKSLSFVIVLLFLPEPEISAVPGGWGRLSSPRQACSVTSAGISNLQAPLFVCGLILPEFLTSCWGKPDVRATHQNKRTRNGREVALRGERHVPTRYRAIPKLQGEKSGHSSSRGLLDPYSCTIPQCHVSPYKDRA